MAVPKRKTSKERQGKRRLKHKLSPPRLVKCPACDALKKPHQVCSECGELKKAASLKKS